jgi:hypothetical protein
MKNPFKNNPLSLAELVKWKNNENINPRSGCKISVNGDLYKLIKKAYLKNKDQVDKMELDNLQLDQNNNIDPILVEKNQESDLINKPFDLDPNLYLKDCNEDRDPISMNLFWIESDGIRQVVYPPSDFKQLILYKDSKQLIRCFEIESLKYLKTYNMNTHPISCEQIPLEVFEGIDKMDISKIQNDKTLENMALDIFQYFSKISIFINYESFLSLDKSGLFKFNYELRDFWLQNFNKKQKNEISKETLLYKEQNDMEQDSLENIQKYLLGQLKILLSCEKEEYKYMINYIIVGALGIVLPEIKEMYPDFSFSFC